MRDHITTERERALDCRVLAVLNTEAWTRQQDVLRLVRMDASMCTLTLRRLRARGLLEASLLSRGRGNGSGAPAYVYRLTAQGAEWRASAQEAA